MKGGSQRGNFQGSMPSRAAPLPQQQVMSQYSGGDNNYNSNMSNVPPPQIPIQQPIVYQPQQQQQIYRQPPQQIAMAPPPLMGQQQNYPHPRQPTEPVRFLKHVKLQSMSFIRYSSLLTSNRIE